jgi:ABC-type lipoprotein export system ATPase subunit
MALLKLDNITTKFGKRVILDNISMNFEKGSITAITGKSGAGKTTLISIISGLMKPDGGKVLYNDNDILKWGDIRRSRYRNKEIGFVFQFFNLLPDMTSYQNIVYPARVSPFRSDVNTDEMAKELVKYLGIGEIINNYPGTLSGGERQRVAIARAIINKPTMILADEPTGNLDDNSAKGILALFKRMRNEYKMCIIVVTHDIRIVAMADHHYHLSNSRLTKIRKTDSEKIMHSTESAIKLPAKKTVKKSAKKAVTKTNRTVKTPAGTKKKKQ